MPTRAQQLNLLTARHTTIQITCTQIKHTHTHTHTNTEQHTRPYYMHTHACASKGEAAPQQASSTQYFSNCSYPHKNIHTHTHTHTHRATHETLVYAHSRVCLQGRSSSTFGQLDTLPFKLDVLYEDDFMAVVRKPAGFCSYAPPQAEGADAFISIHSAAAFFLKPAPVRYLRMCFYTCMYVCMYVWLWCASLRASAHMHLPRQ